MLNTAFMMGGALGLAALVAVSDARRGGLLADGASRVTAMNGGLHAAFVVGALAAFAAAAVGGLLLRPTSRPDSPAPATRSRNRNRRSLT